MGHQATGQGIGHLIASGDVKLPPPGPKSILVIPLALGLIGNYLYFS